MTQPDLSSLALPDSPPKLPAEIERALKDLRYAEFSYGVASAVGPSDYSKIKPVLDALRSVIAQHLLTPKEAWLVWNMMHSRRWPTEDSTAEEGFESTRQKLAALRLLSGSSRGEE